MKQVNFTQGMKPTVQDMNDLHVLTEDALFKLLQAMAGSTGKTLFDTTEPGIFYNQGVSLTVDVSSRYFAINGAVTSIPQTVQSFNATADFQLGVYLVLKKKPIEDVRNFLSLDASNPVLIQQDMTTVVRYEDIGRVEFVVVPDLTTPLYEPVLAPDDVGFVKLGEIAFDSSNIVTPYVYTGNTTDVVMLPTGAATSTPIHGAMHLSGPNAIPAATIGNVSGGSSVGLMPPGSLTMCKNAIQDLAPAVGSDYIQVVHSGTNDLNGNSIDSKTAIIDLNLDSSLTKANNKLGVNFKVPSGVNGYENYAARADHIHALTTTGVIIQSFTMTIDAQTPLGSVIGPFTVTPPATSGLTSNDVGMISAIRVSWKPSGNIPAQYGITADWMIVNAANQSLTSVGCRAIVTSKNMFKIELGEQGVAYISSAAQAEITQLTGVSWSEVYAKSGSIRIDVVALREGAFFGIPTVI